MAIHWAPFGDLFCLSTQIICPTFFPCIHLYTHILILCSLPFLLWFSLIVFVFHYQCLFHSPVVHSSFPPIKGLLSCHSTPVLWLKKVHGLKRRTEFYNGYYKKVQHYIWEVAPLVGLLPVHVALPPVDFVPVFGSSLEPLLVPAAPSPVGTALPIDDAAASAALALLRLTAWSPSTSCTDPTDYTRKPCYVRKNRVLMSGSKVVLEVAQQTANNPSLSVRYRCSCIESTWSEDHSTIECIHGKSQRLYMFLLRLD